MKASEVLGRGAVIREGGRKAGKVKDVIIDPTGKQVLGFVVRERPLKQARVALWGGLQTIGPDNLVFDAATSIIKADGAPEVRTVVRSKLKLKGRKLQTTAGKDLGEIDDVLFDETSGAVLGYELSGRLFASHQFLPTPPAMEIGKDIVFVAPEVEETIQKGKGPQPQEEPEGELQEEPQEEPEEEPQEGPQDNG
jgi:uncharacterized protein YrrD